MTTQNTTTAPQAPIVKPVAIVYEVATAKAPAQVTVTLTERGDVIYKCKCHPFALWGECPHTYSESPKLPNR